MTVDLINQPPHYVGNDLEVIEVIEQWQLGFHLGNVVKYILRSPHKGQIETDLRKALWYLRRAKIDGAIDGKLLTGSYLLLSSPPAWPSIGDLQRNFGALKDEALLEVVQHVWWVAHQPTIEHVASCQKAIEILDAKVREDYGA